MAEKGSAILTTDQKEQIKMAAKARLRNIEGITGVGVNDQAVLIFVRDAAVLALLPRDFANMPVQGFVTGSVKSAAAAR